MTTASLSGGPEPTTRAAAVSMPPAGMVARRWWRGHSAQRMIFGYTLLAPAALYIVLLVGAPFEASSAIAPATCGEASEVPLIHA